MIDLSPIKDYLDKPTQSMESFVKCQVETVGLDTFINNDYNKLDCSRVYNSGLRVMQTIGYPYRHMLTEFVYLIATYVEDEKVQEEWFTKLIQRHNDNIEYEKVNPPTWYGTEKDKRNFEKKYGKKSSTKRKRKKEGELDFPDMPKKQTAAEKKLAARVAKINALSFKIKPQN